MNRQADPDFVKVDEIVTLFHPEYFKARIVEYKRRAALGKYDIIGSFNHYNCDRRKDFGIIALDDYDKEHVLPTLKLKNGDIVLRFTTETTEIGGFSPLIKINLKYNMVYFIEDFDDDENPIFETRGNKLTFLNLIANYEELL